MIVLLPGWLELLCVSESLPEGVDNDDGNFMELPPERGNRSR